MRLGQGKQFPKQRADRRRRVRIFLGRGHPFADGSGRAWRSRLVVGLGKGRPLDPREHVHHRGEPDDDRVRMLKHFENGAEHNRMHAREQERDERGRFA